MGAQITPIGMKITGGLTVYGDIHYTGTSSVITRRLTAVEDEDEERDRERLRSDVEELKAKLKTVNISPSPEDQNEVAELREVLAEYRLMKEQQDKIIRDMQDKFAELMAKFEGQMQER